MHVTAFLAKTRSKRKSTGLVLSVALASILAACGGKEPTLGETIRAQGVELATIGDQWSEGDEKLTTGQEQLERGQEMVEEGQELLEYGRENVEAGKALKIKAEADYRQKTGQELPVN